MVMVKRVTDPVHAARLLGFRQHCLHFAKRWFLQPPDHRVLVYMERTQRMMYIKVDPLSYLIQGRALVELCIRCVNICMYAYVFMYSTSTPLNVSILMLPLAELHRYGGGLVDTEAKDSPTLLDPNKQGAMPSKTPAEVVVASGPSAANPDGYHVGVPSQWLPGVIPRIGQRPFQKWKGPDKISRIYGDWIDDIE